tara:strand:- start:101 stop:283 length:183 start_codon:yes stop_codon:yes gene_type:complete
MSDICRNLGDVMQKYYEEELNADTPLLFNSSGVYTVRLDNWPTWISEAPTLEHLNSLIGE